MSKKRSIRQLQLIIVCIMLLITTQTFANMIYCFDIFNNDAYENDYRLNFTVTVTDEGFNYYGRQLVGFEFNNNSTASSSITDIYFDDSPDKNLLYKNTAIIEGDGVEFSAGARPKSLPGGNELDPKFDKNPDFSTDSDSPVSHNGINPGEWLKVVFKLTSGKVYQDVLDEIGIGGSRTQDNLRIGMHIQDLPKPLTHSFDMALCCVPTCYEDSASAINCTNPVPEPATMMLLGLGGVLIRRKNRNHK